MSWPFALVQYSCIAAVTKWPYLKSQPLHSRRFSCTKQQNLYSDMVRINKRAQSWKSDVVSRIIHLRAQARRLCWQLHALGETLLSGGHTAGHSGAGTFRTLWAAVAGPRACRVVALFHRLGQQRVPRLGAVRICGTTMCDVGMGGPNSVSWLHCQGIL